MSKAVKKINELRNVDVVLVSLVDKGANQKSLIWKAAGEDAHNIEKVLILKVDDEQRRVYCPVYVPDEVDAHGDYMTAAEIQKACDNFMKKSKTNAVDKQHDMSILDGVCIVENWIVKEGDAFFGEHPGAWAMGMKIENEDVWQDIKKGVITGFSMYGFAEKVEQKKTDKKSESVIEKVKKFLSELADTDYIDEMNAEQIVKDFNESYASMDLQNVVSAMNCALWDAIYDSDEIMTKDEMIAEMISSADQFKAKLAEISSAASVAEKASIQKAGKTISDANMTKLKNALDSIMSIMEAAGKAETKKTEILEKIKPSEMNAEEINKAVTDAVTKAVAEAVEPLNKEVETLKSEKVNLENEIATLKKTSNGSKQGDPVIDGAETKKEEKPIYKWTGGVQDAVNKLKETAKKA